MNVNWKFWTWRRDLRHLWETYEAAAQSLQERTQELEAALERRDRAEERREELSRYIQEHEAGLSATILELERRLSAVYQRTPAILTEAEQKNVNLERMLTLAGLAEDHPVWRTVLSFADEHARNETASVLLNNLDDAARHYNAGRAASASDFASALRELKVTAKAAARKLTKEKE